MARKPFDEARSDETSARRVDDDVNPKADERTFAGLHHRRRRRPLVA
jgi:hypothetical protein